MQCSNMASMTQRQESLIREKPGHRIQAEDGIQQQIPTSENNTHGLGEQMHSSIEATQRCPGVHKDKLHQPQNTNSFREMEHNITYMVFEGGPAVKLHAKNVKVGTRANGNPRQDRVTTGRVDSPGSTNH